MKAILIHIVFLTFFGRGDQSQWRQIDQNRLKLSMRPGAGDGTYPLISAISGFTYLREHVETCSHM